MHSRYYYNIALLIISSISCTVNAVASSLADFKHKSAGVLPIFKQKSHYKLHNECIDNSSQTSDVWVLLTREAFGKAQGTYDSLSGKADPGESALETAGREASEEIISRQTMHKGAKQMTNYIHPRRTFGHTKHIIVYDNEKRKPVSKHVTYITYFDQHIDTIHRTFYAARAKETDNTFREKDRLAYVKWDDLKSVINDNPRNSHLEMEALVVNPKTLKLEKETIKLRPYLVVTLREFFEGKPYTQGKESKVRFYTH